MNPLTPDQVREIRLRHGWTQQQVADTLGVVRHTISKRERGAPGYGIDEQISMAYRHLDEHPEVVDDE